MQPKEAAHHASLAMRRPTPEERAAMHAALDRFVEDERTLREQNRAPHHGFLYAPEIERHMEDCIDGKPIDPELMWCVLDALDQFHRQISASPRQYARERQGMRDLMDGTA
jgi:hypothetical protein